jgi:formylglycine-generating enzyme required for sulfatase activity
MAQSSRQPSPFEYDAFISYRRSDGSLAARWLRSALLRYRLPRQLRADPSRKLSVYLDTSFERATEDFFENNIKPALLHSRWLIVIATPNAVNPRPDGSPNWVEREIDVFSKTPHGQNILIATTTPNLSGPLPAKLHERFPNTEVVSLRDCSPARFLVWTRWWRLRDELIKIVAPLFDVAVTDMPVLRQEERNRRLKLAWSVAFVSLLLLTVMTVLAGWAYREYRLAEENRKAEHRAQVAALRKSDPRAVADLIHSLTPPQDDILALLREGWLQPDPAAQTERARCGLALLALSPSDRPQVQPGLFQWMVQTTDLQEALVVRDTLRPYAAPLRQGAWSQADDTRLPQEQRFRALIALAAFDPDSTRWSSLADQVAGQLVESNPLHLPALIQVFEPIRHHLIASLAKTFQGSTHPGKGGVAAAILAEYAAGDVPTLAGLIQDADPAQFATIFPLLNTETNRPQAIQLLNRDITSVPAQPVKHSRAAAALWQLGRPDLVYPLIRHHPDPTLRSFLIHSLASLGTPATSLIQRLTTTADVSERRALILSLSAYNAEQLPPDLRQKMIPALLNWYRTDPDPGIHGAIDWLLRHGAQGPVHRLIDWHQKSALQQIDNQLSGQPQGDRKWYVNSLGQTMTIVPGPVTFQMGSRLDGEEDKFIPKRIGRSFAIAAKEVTVAQFMQYLRERPQDYNALRPAIPDVRPYLERYSPGGDGPMLGVTWFEAALFCNWLSTKEGLPTCYIRRFIDGNVNISEHLLEEPCYRLPTEAEWEYAARAGATTTWSFGSDLSLLPEHAWFIKNSKSRSWPVGQLKPNDLGLFDMYGNAVEWLQEREGMVVYNTLKSDPYLITRQQGPDDQQDSHLVADEQSNRVLRGGSFSDPETMATSRDRNFRSPGDRSINYGFRVARTIKLTNRPE